MKGNKNVNLPKFLGGKAFKTHITTVTHSLSYSAAPHKASLVCLCGAKPGGHVCLPPDIHLGWFFCHQYPELLVASYNNNEDAPHEPDGVALVWNMKYKKTTPEYVFHCQVPKPLFNLPLLHCHSPSPHPNGWLPPRQAWNPANQPLFVHSLSSSFSLYPHTPHPLACIHTVSSPCWHPPPPHLSTNTCLWGAGEDLWCRSWMESEHCSRIKCVGQGWLWYASKQGPCVLTSKQGEQHSSSALPSLIILPAPRLLEQDKLSRTTCCCLQSGCRCRRIAQMNKTEQKCEHNFLCASKSAQNEISIIHALQFLSKKRQLRKNMEVWLWLVKHWVRVDLLKIKIIHFMSKVII